MDEHRTPEGQQDNQTANSASSPEPPLGVASDAQSGAPAGTSARFQTPAHVQAAYERAYYEAAGEPMPEDDFFGAQEQAHADPFVAAISDATGQRQGNASSAQQQSGEGPRYVSSSYQQPWDGSSSSQGYGQTGWQASGGQGWSGSSPYSQQAPQGQAYYPYVVTKDHVAAGLLAIFLGGFGVHKFYLGYNTAAFTMLGVTIIGSLFTFGLAGAVMSFIGFVEGIIYLVKSQTAFDAQYVYGRKEWF